MSDEKPLRLSKKDIDLIRRALWIATHTDCDPDDKDLLADGLAMEALMKRIDEDLRRRDQKRR